MIVHCLLDIYARALYSMLRTRCTVLKGIERTLGKHCTGAKVKNICT